MKGGALGAVVLGLSLLGAVTPAMAKPMLDCPLRDAPFSLESPMIDILLSPAAVAAVEQAAPGMVKKLPAQMFSATAPTFASILTLTEASTMMARFSAGKPQDVTPIGAALAKVPVMAADKVARCVRYDNDKPTFAIPAGKPRVLLFEKMTGFRDGPSVDAAHAAFLDIAKQRGWSIVSTDRGGAITPAILSKFDAVIWNNVSGDVLTLTQRKAFRNYIEQGGGFVAVHGSAGDPVYFWDWYADSLIGARFAGHPIAKHFQDARVVVEGKDSPVAKRLPAEWTMKDEWYSFKNNPRATGSTIIATLDESSYQPDGIGGQNLRMGDHPIAWTRCVGKGRSFYSAIGHMPATYSEPHYRIMLENGIEWAMAKSACGKN